MQPRSLTLLEDISRRCAFIRAKLAGKTVSDYEGDEMIRLAVERSFEIIGEALLRLERSDPAVLAYISDYRRIIGFRNRLAHGYDAIDDAVVWQIAVGFLPILCGEVEHLLDAPSR